MTVTALVGAVLTGEPPVRVLDVDAVDVAPGVVAWTEPAINPLVSGNIVAVIGDRSVLVFDAGHHPAVTRKVIADLKRRTQKPVTDLVISHWHDDHWVAAPEFVTAWPGVRVIAHPFTAAMIGTRAAAMAPAPCRHELRPPLESMRRRAREGKRPDGSPLPEASRIRLARFIRAGEEALAQCGLRRPTEVTQVIADSLIIDLGGRSVVLRHPGRANTAGDLIALIPDLTVLLTGDLVVAPFPYATMPYLTEWARALRGLEARSGWTLVPGHGPVQRNPDYVRAVADVLESIASQARAAWRPGLPEDSLRARIDVSAHAERFARGDPFLRVNFDAQMGSAISRMWQELEGAWRPEASSPR
ncbi:MAG: MBL fold metallo-hydrolase [Gemmatimonadales bacterium]|nr:MBL fold metallo-hydrolase [Gemmatimonadales bacterium]